MKRSTAQILVAVGVLVVIIGAVEHFFLRTEVIPHLAIILGVIGVLVAAGGVFGIVTSKTGA
jgi:hypothetical protein